VFFPKSLAASYAYNPAKAKQLLQQAGYRNGLNLTLVTLPNYPVADQTAQIVQSEWKAIGVKLTLRQSVNYVSDLYVNHEGQTAVNPTINPGLARLNTFHPGFIGDLCNYNNPELDSIVTQLDAVAPTSPQAVRLWDQVQTIISQQALAVWIDFLPVAAATSGTVVDANLVTSYIQPVPDYHTIHISG
jgi:peptide/nickel transport system substrate-binding protein